MNAYPVCSESTTTSKLGTFTCNKTEGKFGFRLLKNTILLLLMAVLFCFTIPLIAQDTTGKDTTVEIKSNMEKKTFVYKTVGKLPIKLDLFQKKGNTELKPVVIWIHGGALMSGRREGIAEEQKKFYIDAGYSVVSIDYRLAPETKLPGIIEDIKDAIQWVRQNGANLLHVDRTKTFVVGHSAGGYLALMTGYVLKNPPTAIVSFYGYGDIKGDWYSKPDSFYLTLQRISEERARELIRDTAIASAPFDDRFDMYVYIRQNGKWPFMIGGHDPKKEAAWFDQYCPVKNIHKNYPPVLLVHGDNDLDVPFEQSVLMDQELARKGIRHMLIRVKDGPHVFDRAKGAFDTPAVKRIFADISAFLNSRTMANE